ncbi:GNAT family N-acetyltransferase [Metabacillus herbersteinensis]|uniref:GNAT family N-acetyltransferase n=1 Tax=Metabacillus herbersteinensis TaxID=283816 RepID=A0ABV6GAN2_9BACI
MSEKIFPVLETSRLQLREIHSGDAEVIYSYFSNPRVVEYYGMLPMKEVEEATSLVEIFQKGFKSGTSIRWGIVISESDQFIGTIGYHNWNKTHHRAEIGYEIHPKYRRKGYAIEALEAVSEYGFEQLHLHRIGALVRPENLPSQQLLEKQGFENEGLLKDYQHVAGHYYNLTMFSKVKSIQLAK